MELKGAGPVQELFAPHQANFELNASLCIILN